MTRSPRLEIKMTLVKNLLRMAAIALPLAAALFAAPVSAQTAFTPAQRTQIEAIIKDYLIKNPDVLREALIEMEKRSKADEAAQRAKVVADLAPKLFNSKNQVVLGNPNGKIQVVEFYDYNCGYCKRAMADMMDIIKKNPDVRMVLKEFPVLGPGSVEAAQVATALHQQFDGEKYLAFHQRLMSSRGQVARAQAMAAAKAVGADMDKLEAAINSDAVRAGIQEVMQIADALSLTGTPSYVVGDEVVVGAVGQPTLQQKIDNIRKCGKATCG
jgi:protein-disulfide isomerase